MEAQQAIDLIREAMWITFLISSPILITALIVGVFISLIQAVTQIQEMTLSFVPKIIIVMLVLAIALPWMLTKMTDYTISIFELLEIVFK